MKLFSILWLLLACSQMAFSQKFISSGSSVRFFSSAPLEDIEATTTTARSVLDIETGEFVYMVKIKDFQFDKSLMQEHFNENYMESEKYPEGRFKGKIVDWNKAKGEQKVTARGEFEIHGIKREVDVSGTINYQDNQVQVNAVFPIKLEDYKIKIPKAVFYNIAEEVEVTVQFQYKPYEK